MSNNIYPWHADQWEHWNNLRVRLPHALLLKGAKGTGKFNFAMAIAESALCERPGPEGLACHVCPSCHWMLQHSHPDFRLIQPEAMTEFEGEDVEEGKKKPSRFISVDQIRGLMDFANLSAHRGGRRVVLIHPAETMNTNAANALLKTLEEPSPGLMIVLVTHKSQQLLPTIRSRCLTMAMPVPSTGISISWLKQQGINSPQENLAFAGFAPLRVLDNASNETSVDFHAFLQGIREADNFNAYALAEKFHRHEITQVIQWLQQWCYDLASYKLAGKARYHQGWESDMKKLSSKINITNLFVYQRELQVTKREALHPLNPRLLLESLFLSYRQLLTAA